MSASDTMTAEAEPAAQANPPSSDDGQQQQKPTEELTEIPVVVAVHIRPLIYDEIAAGCRTCLSVVDQSSQVRRPTMPVLTSWSPTRTVPSAPGWCQPLVNKCWVCHANGAFLAQMHDPLAWFGERAGAPLARQTPATSVLLPCARTDREKNKTMRVRARSVYAWCS